MSEEREKKEPRNQREREREEVTGIHLTRGKRMLYRVRWQEYCDEINDGKRKAFLVSLSLIFFYPLRYTETGEGGEKLLRKGEKKRSHSVLVEEGNEKKKEENERERGTRASKQVKKLNQVNERRKKRRTKYNDIF